METPPKVLFHDQRMAEQWGDGTSIPQIQLGTSQFGREGKGEIVIKQGQVQQGMGFRKFRKKGLEKNKREKVEIDIYF